MDNKEVPDKDWRSTVYRQVIKHIYKCPQCDTEVKMNANKSLIGNIFINIYRLWLVIVLRTLRSC